MIVLLSSTFHQSHHEINFLTFVHAMNPILLSIDEVEGNTTAISHHASVGAGPLTTSRHTRITSSRYGTR